MSTEIMERPATAKTGGRSPRTKHLRCNRCQPVAPATRAMLCGKVVTGGGKPSDSFVDCALCVIVQAEGMHTCGGAE